MTVIRVLIVDDHPSFRRTIRTSLEDYPNDIQVVGEAADGQQAIDLVDRVQPDVVLMDIRMRVMDGVTTTRMLREQHPACHIILLTSHCERELVVKGLQAGATGYILKEYGGEELVRAITAAYQGETLLSPPVATTVLHEFLDSRPRQPHKPVYLRSRRSRFCAEWLLVKAMGKLPNNLCYPREPSANTLSALSRSLERPIAFMQ